MSTQYPTPPQQYQPTHQPATIATASVVLGAVGFVVGICSVIGLILGLVARGKAKRGEISPARVKTGIVVSTISLVLGVIGWIIVMVAISAGVDSTNTATASLSAPASVSSEESAPEAATTPPPAAEETSAATEAPAAPAADGSIRDGDWSAADIQLEDSLGSFGGTIRLTGPDAQGALVQLTVLSGGSVVATLQGASNEFSGTETVQLISGDKYAAGDYTYELKVTSY